MTKIWPRKTQETLSLWPFDRSKSFSPGQVTLSTSYHYEFRAPRLMLGLSNTQKDRQHHALATYGNYRNYYFHRTPCIPDSRLSLLPPSLLLNKSVLDLGCNAGKLTVECVTHLGARRAKGVDLDQVLIAQAKEKVVERVEFEWGDFMHETKEWFEETKGQGEWDTVLLLSITKWLHLHHGDIGLRKLFKALHDLLSPSGVLIIEPQEWDNYKQAVRKNKSLRETFKTLMMRPPFEEELREVGFGLEECIEREEGGFSRPLMVWRKGGMGAEAIEEMDEV